MSERSDWDALAELAELWVLEVVANNSTGWRDELHMAVQGWLYGFDRMKPSYWADISAWRKFADDKPDDQSPAMAGVRDLLAWFDNKLQASNTSESTRVERSDLSS